MTWQTKKIGEVCDIVNGSTPLRNNKEFWHNGNVAWFTIDDIREQGRVIKSTKQKITQKALGKISNRLLPPESVLICCTASVGEYAITEIPLTTNQQFNGLVVKDKRVLDPLFLFYFASTLKDQLLGLSGKTTIDFIPISRLKNIEILLPPIEEQKRIVKLLDEIFNQVVKVKENAEKNLENSKKLFESYLQSVFANPGKDWEEKRLSELFKIKPPKKEAKEKLEDSDLVSFVPMEDMQIMQKEFVCNKEKKMKEVIGSYTYFSDGDVLLAKITPCFENGKLGIARNLKNGIGFGSSEYIVFRANGKVIPDYLYYFLARDQFRREGAKRMSGAVGHKRVSKEFIEQNILFFPKSISEQKNIVKKLDKLAEQTKKLEAIYTKKLAGLEELKKSILKKAFAGELLSEEKTPAENLIPAPSAFFRNQVHAAIIGQVVKDGGWTTEVAVAKYDHLLQEIFGLNLGYRFQTQKFGPFDAQIKKLIYAGLGHNRWFAKQGMMIKPGSNFGNLILRQSNLYHAAENAMRELAKLKVTILNADKLELLSTICHSIKEKKTTALNEIRDFMAEWPTDGNRTKADKFSEEDVKKCLDFIIRNNFHLKLLNHHE